MRVKAILSQRDECPPEIARFVSVTPMVTKGNEYEVHSISLSESVLMLQIVDDFEYPRWFPAALFEATDTSLAPDWMCSVFNGYVRLLIGPPFIAKDEDSYGRMVEMDADQVDQFWKRIEGINTSKSSDF